MAIQQTDALDFNPNALDLTKVSTLNRDISAPIIRVWENVLDWEHLPHLHNTSFDFVALDESADWGWRTWANAEKTGHIELVIDPANSRYVARSYKAGQQISEIWTTLIDAGETTQIEVAFWAPDVDPARKDELGTAYLSLYELLWDEDETMMSERHRRLTEPRDRRDSVELGPRDSLDLPIQVEMMGNVFTVREIAGEITADPAMCPHLLGPLSRNDQNELFCPWHGYRFDPETGKCKAPATASCKLPRTPIIHEHKGVIILKDIA